MERISPSEANDEVTDEKHSGSWLAVAGGIGRYSRIAEIKLQAHFVTTIRVPGPVNSVVVGDPALFQVEHSEHAKFGAGLRSLRSRRDEFRLVIQSYSRIAALVPWSLERALKSLGMDHADILLLGLWNKDVSPGVFDQALRLRERGLIRAIAVSTHNRPQAAAMANHNGDVDLLHVRCNAVHPGEERDIFPKLPSPEVRPGIVSFTATCWGDLMKPDKVPAGDKIPSASDCYRFNLTNPAVDLCLTGPRSASNLAAALDALGKGPMTPEEMEWMRRGGKAKYFKPRLLSIKG